MNTHFDHQNHTSDNKGEPLYSSLRPSTRAAIEKTLRQVILARTLSARTRSFCASARISPPTFYAHYRNLDELRLAYERDILQGLSVALPNHRTSLSSRYELFLAYIYRKRYYFIACATVQDYFLLTQLVRRLLPIAATRTLSPRAKAHYLGVLRAIIHTWITHDQCNKTKIPDYVERLVRTKPESMDF